MKAVIKRMMVLRTLMALTALMTITSLQAQVKIGQDAESKKGTVLELNSNSDGYIGGLRLSNVWITDINSIPAGFTENVLNTTEKDSLAGAIIYNTNPGLKNEKNETTGIGVYYWTGTKWVKEIPNTIDAWLTTGNAGTDPTINFLGTTDNQSLMFKINNQHAGSIGSTTFNYPYGGSVSLGVDALKENPFSEGNVAIGLKTLTANKFGYKNIAIGYHVLRENTSGSGNIALGEFALLYNISGGKNIALGYGALLNNISGSENMALGESALGGSTSSGGSNIALGNHALYGNNGEYNIGIGKSTLYGNSTGHHNVAIGSWALNVNKTASHNVAIGKSTLYNNYTGEYNIALGCNALLNNNTGHHNVALGLNALASNSRGGEGGNYNIGIGYWAANGMNSGERNVVVGDYAMSSGDGDKNVAIGSYAMSSLIEGNRNVAIGGNAAQYFNKGDNNTAIGWQAGMSVEGSNNINIGAVTTTGTGDNKMNIGNLIYATGIANNYPSWTLKSSGNVGIGTPEPQAKLHIVKTEDTSAGFILEDGTQQDKYVLTSDANGVGTWQNISNIFTPEESDSCPWYDANPTGNENIGIGADDVSYAMNVFENKTPAKPATSNTEPAYLSEKVFIGRNRYVIDGVDDEGEPKKKFIAGTIYEMQMFYANTSVENYDVDQYQLFVGGDAMINGHSLGRGGGNIVSNLSVGHSALKNNTEGKSNTAVGHNAGNHLTTGERNTIIGAQLPIDIKGTNSSNALTGDNNILIGYDIALTGSVSNQVIIGNNENTDYFIKGGSTGWTNTSDRRLKHDIKPIVQGLDFVLKLKPVEFLYNNGNGKIALGFIAQDIQEIMSQESMSGYNLISVANDETQTLGLNAIELVPVLTKAIQEQQLQIETQQKIIEQLMARLNAIEAAK